MLYLISAPPRTGKTLKMIEIIFKHLNDGRFVYTNIIGINIPGVFTFSSGIDNPHDWRDLPNGSVVIYDEAHEHPAFADRNLIQDKKRMAEVRDIGISLTLHGHFGFDIYLITQNPRLLAPEILASVGTHYIMRRKFGFDMATIFEYGEAKTTFSKSTASEALVKTFWKYPKHLYKYYVSSENHNIKKTFPFKYWIFSLIPLLLFYKGYSNASSTGFFGLFGKDEQVQVEQPASAPQSTPVLNEQQTEQAMISTCLRDENITKTECIDFLGQVSEKRNAQKSINSERYELNGSGSLDQGGNANGYSYSVEYDITKPYEHDYSKAPRQVNQLPVLAGCAIDLKNKCSCYTQQMTMIKLADADCKRYINGDKPFNPFLSNNQGVTNEISNPQAVEKRDPQVDQPLTQQVAKAYAMTNMSDNAFVKDADK